MTPPASRSRLATLLVAIGVASWLAGAAAAPAPSPTPAGTVLSNRAAVGYEIGGAARTGDSNPVDATVASVCALALTPDGAAAAPAHDLALNAGETGYLPYRIENLGNEARSFSLAVVADPTAPFARAEVHRDVDGDGLPDGAALASIALGIGEGADLLLVLEAAVGATPTDTTVDLRAACPAGGPRDEENRARVRIGTGGVVGFVKGALPAPGALVTGGDELRYDIAFDVGGSDLAGVLLRDALDPALGAPRDVVVEIDGADRSAWAAYDPVAHELRVDVAGRLEPLPAGSRVRLRFAATVDPFAAGGRDIVNRAEVSHDRGASRSNETRHPLASRCGLDVQADGTAAAPGRRVVALPGATAVVPYSVRNTGNLVADVALILRLLPASGVTPVSLRLVHDLDGDGAAGPGEPVATAIAGLAPGATAQLLALVELPADPLLSGSVLIGLDGATDCGLAATVRDDGNVAEVAVAVAGFSTPSKSAEPAAGTPVAPGQLVRYRIAFTAQGRELRDVVVRDPLPASLAAPASLTAGTVDDPATGLRSQATAEAADGVVTWRLDRVPAGMTVVLEVTAPVRDDAAPGTVLTNVACTLASGVAETCSNAVVHDVQARTLELAKSADRERARVGDDVVFTLAVANPGAIDVERLELRDELPAGLRYRPGSTVLVRAGAPDEPLEPSEEGAELVWSVGRLASGARLELRFAARVLPTAADLGVVVNRARALALDAAGGVLVEAADEAAVRIDPGLYGARAVLLGTVFVDEDGDGRYREGLDRPVEGVRLVLADGATVLSDDRGRYTFPDLPPGATVLKVDGATLPGLLPAPTPDEAAPGLWRVRLERGLVARRDVPLRPPGARLAVTEELELRRGPLRLRKRVALDEAGRLVVELVLRTDAPLRDVVVVDPRPGAAPSARFEIAHLAPGEARVLTHATDAAGASAAASAGEVVLTAPAVTWRVRP